MSRSGRSVFFFCTFTTKVLGLSLVMEASTSVEICPSATLVPLVAMSLGLAGEALAAAGREMSAPVHVDSSFAARGDPPGSDGVRGTGPPSRDAGPQRAPEPPARHGDTQPASHGPVGAPGSALGAASGLGREQGTCPTKQTLGSTGCNFSLWMASESTENRTKTTCKE